MEFIDSHNELAMLQKPKQSTGFHQIVDFLKKSHISHALTIAPVIYVEHQRQFWANATVIEADGQKCIQTRICDQPLMITEEDIRIALHLEDASGITSISNDDLFSSLQRMGYAGPIGVFKFYKAKFSPQWRFFVHTLMHSISRKTTGWSEFSSTIAYALVCLSTARVFNFSQMILTDLVSNLEAKKSFYMYPRFVQAVITMKLTDIPQFDEVYVPKPPKGKVFSNMRRTSGDAEGVDTPLFSTMVDVSPLSQGMASRSQPSLDQPIDDQSQPSHSQTIPQSILNRPNPQITQQFQRRKAHKAPSLGVSTKEPQQPQSPHLEHSPSENIIRETTGVSPNPKEVLTKEMHEHVGDKAATTSVSKKKASGNIIKTFPTATLSVKTPKGPRRQETKGTEGVSARQKTPVKRSKDPEKEGKTSGSGEDRYTYQELMEALGNINMDVQAQRKEIDALKKVVTHQQSQIDKQKKLITKLLHKKKKQQFVLKRRTPKTDASKKGETSEAQVEGEPQVEGETWAETDKVEIEVEVEKETEEKVKETAETEEENKAEEAKEQAAVTEQAAQTDTTAPSLAVETEAEITPAVVTETTAGKEQAAESEPAVVTDTTAGKEQEAETAPAVVTDTTAEDDQAAETKAEAEMDTTAEVKEAVVTGLSTEEVLAAETIAEIKTAAKPEAKEAETTKPEAKETESVKPASDVGQKKRIKTVAKKKSVAKKRKIEEKKEKKEEKKEDKPE